jgi:hypothetical protein
MLQRLWLLPSKRKRSLSSLEERTIFKYMGKERLEVLQANLVPLVTYSDANIQVAQQPFDAIRIGFVTSVISTNQIPKRFLALWLIPHLVSGINSLEATNYVIICAQRRLSTSFTGPACYLDAPKY